MADDKILEMAAAKDPPKKKYIVEHCMSLVAFVLVVVAFGGPFYAFVLMSCVSTNPCEIGVLAMNLGVKCKEDPDLEDMMHGDVCTVVCDNPEQVPNVQKLVCDDGIVLGGEQLQCAKRKVFVAPKQGGLQEGAITGGQLRTACVRAKNLKCAAGPGGTSLLLSMPNVTATQCSSLLNECKGMNSMFTFMDHLAYIGADAVYGGICNLGCMVSAIPEGGGAPILPTPEPERDYFAEPSSYLPRCPGMPMCIHVNYSCNEADNGDYYRYPTCISDEPQWVKLSASHRIRYDSSPQWSQGGKWIIERLSGDDVSPAILPMYENRGLELGRQPIFQNQEPMMGWFEWQYNCRRKVSAVEYAETFKKVNLFLGDCTCTDYHDCNGNGKASGSKLNGPNCQCTCNKGYRGKNCDIRMCKSPGVLYAANPACKEGEYIDPGQTCTPLCEEGYIPTNETYTCTADGAGLQPAFICERSRTAPPPLSADALAYIQEFGLPVTTTPRPPCSAIDCRYRGEPKFPERNADGSCICLCYGNFTGSDCSSWKGSCPAPEPATIMNAADPTCEEGSRVETVCTPQCKPGYIPLPAELSCQSNALDPPTFVCFGGPSIRETWCKLMKDIALWVTIASSVVLLCMCICRTPQFKRLVRDVTTRNGLVIKAGRDYEDGSQFYVVESSNANDFGSKLPPRLASRLNALQNEMDQHEALVATGKLTVGALLEVEDAKYTMEVTGEGDYAGLALSRTTGGLGNRYLVDNSQLKDPGEGLAFRNSKKMNDTDANKLRALWGCTVVGNDAGHDWVKVGSRYLPMYIRGARVLTLVGPNYDPDNDESSNLRALALENGSPVNQDLQILDLERGSPGGWPAKNRLTAKENAALLRKVDDGTVRSLEETLEEEENQVPDITYDQPWLLKKLELEVAADDARREHGKKLQAIANKGALEAAASVDEALQDTLEERIACDKAMRDAMAAGDGAALDAAVKRTKAVLDKLKGMPPGPTASLSRVLMVAETRVDQYHERLEARASKRAHEERVEAGFCPDWTITPEQLWRYVEQCNVAKVNAGMRAHLPVAPKSKDGLRRTIMHVACRKACSEASADVDKRRLLVIRSLLDGKADPNPADVNYWTPLDLALAEGGEGAEESSIVKGMRRLGLLTATEEAGRLRALSDAAEAGVLPSAVEDIPEEEPDKQETVVQVDEEKEESLPPVSEEEEDPPSADEDDDDDDDDEEDEDGEDEDGEDDE
eukprot:TRINITY_DN1317_c3_g1_i1.p1 TRINITY_DN1317_c3_g1~~TRINITY_DN1317_c3_g1_i1.p1  ORF type:complete len:1233 (+),score=207.23 TRINITY_DN1317_c3_g1_i1:248-3946(+)